MTDNYVERILTSRVYDVAVETPLDDAAELIAQQCQARFSGI